MVKGALLSEIRACIRPSITEVVAVVNQNGIKKNKSYTISGFTQDEFVMIVGSGYKYPLECFKVA